jgi:hypothetical protein
MLARPNFSRGLMVVVANSLAVAGCASNPCQPRYYYSIGEGTVRMPPSEQCALHRNRQHQIISASLPASPGATAEPLAREDPAGDAQR